MLGAELGRGREAPCAASRTEGLRAGRHFRSSLSDDWGGRRFPRHLQLLDFFPKIKIKKQTAQPH